MPSVLVTGAGGGVGQSIIKCLQNTDMATVAADSEVLATGLYAAKKGYLIPYASSPDYIDRLIEICKRENCSLILPGLDAELRVLARESMTLEAAGIKAVVSTPDVIEISDNKLATFEFLSKHGFPAPKTLSFSGDLQTMEFPFVLKPRLGGARSKGVFIVKDEIELARLARVIDRENYVAQEFVDGDEYTCGSVNFDGRCFGVIVMRRILRDGDTYKAFVEHRPELVEYVKTVAESLKPYGACNFQLRVKDGIPFIFEINARHSGTTHCRALAGFNEPLMVSQFLIEGKVPQFEIRQISVLRYWQELVVENDAINQVRDSGSVLNTGALGL